MRWRAALRSGLVAVAVVGLVAWVVTAPTLGDDSMVGRSGIIAAAAAFVALLVDIRADRRSAPGPVDPQTSRQSADLLANAVLEQWQKEARIRGITGPGQLEVAWRWAGSDIVTPADHMNPRYDGPTSGVVTDLVDFYRGLDPNLNKLIILGDSGSGKTAAMVLLLIGLLKARKTDEPVPVLITLGGWNPTKQTLRDYAATVIGRDYRFTRERVFGGEQGPTALLDARQVALFFDGLDEMPAELRAVATEKIDEERTLPIVMTSRVGEYASATKENGLYGAVIQMDPLSVDQAIDALKIGQKADRAAVWKRFTERLEDEPSKALLWTSPLSLSLLRQTYATSEDDPYELFDEKKFPHENMIRTALIERVLEQAYPDPKQRDNATHWLTWIAFKLDDTRDIRWWEIPAWTRHLRLTLSLIGGLVIGLAGGISVGVAGGPGTGLVVGFAFGLLGLGLGTRVQPKSVVVRRLSWSGLLSGLFVGALVGLVVGLLFGWLTGLLYGPFVGRWLGLAFGLLAGLGIFLWLLYDELGQPIEDSTFATPALAYRLDRRYGLVVGLLIGIGSALLLGLVVGLTEGILAGLLYGLASGLLIGFMTWPWQRPAWLLSVSGFHLGVIARRRFQPMKLLEKARERQILRQVGSVYQFRHAELQDHLVSKAASDNPRWVNDRSLQRASRELAWPDDLAWTGDHH